MFRQLVRNSLVILVVAAAAVSSAAARAPEVYMDQGGFFGEAWAYAVDGYDVVAYYQLEEGAPPVEGNDAFAADYKGVKWRFSSQENLDAFVADPDRYRPQYGGYCAWAVAKNKLAKGHPEHWYVHDGKLYLNVSARIRRDWIKNMQQFLEQSEQNWPGVLEN